MAVRSVVSLCFSLQLLFFCKIPSVITTNCAISGCETSSVLVRKSCRCDNECALYDDCCSDFTPSANARSGASPLHEFLECSKVDFTGDLLDINIKSLLMVSRCPQPTEHQEQCTNASLFLPVTDPHTNFTFRNVYCALCNNISREQVLPWESQFSCPSLQRTENLSTFEAVTGVCFLKMVVPSSRAPGTHTRSCIPHEFTCSNSSSSSNDLVHNCTRGPYDLVTTLDKRIFRNQYCAQCNGVNSTQCLMLPNISNTSGELLTGETSSYKGMATAIGKNNTMEMRENMTIV